MQVCKSCCPFLIMYRPAYFSSIALSCSFASIFQKVRIALKQPPECTARFGTACTRAGPPDTGIYNRLFFSIAGCLPYFSDKFTWKPFNGCKRPNDYYYDYFYTTFIVLNPSQSPYIRLFFLVYTAAETYLFSTRSRVSDDCDADETSKLYAPVRVHPALARRERTMRRNANDGQKKKKKKKRNGPPKQRIMGFLRRTCMRIMYAPLLLPRSEGRNGLTVFVFIFPIAQQPLEFLRETHTHTHARAYTPWTILAGRNCAYIRVHEARLYTRGAPPLPICSRRRAVQGCGSADAAAT